MSFITFLCFLKLSLRTYPPAKLMPSSSFLSWSDSYRLPAWQTLTQQSIIDWGGGVNSAKVATAEVSWLLLCPQSHTHIYSIPVQIAKLHDSKLRLKIWTHWSLHNYSARPKILRCLRYALLHKKAFWICYFNCLSILRIGSSFILMMKARFGAFHLKKPPQKTGLLCLFSNTSVKLVNHFPIWHRFKYAKNG